MNRSELVHEMLLDLGGIGLELREGNIDQAKAEVRAAIEKWDARFVEWMQIDGEWRAFRQEGGRWVEVR